MRAFFGCDGVPEGEVCYRAFCADPLGCDLYIVFTVVVRRISSAAAFVGGVRGGVGGGCANFFFAEPRRGVGYGGRGVAGMAGVVDDAVEAYVCVVC